MRRRARRERRSAYVIYTWRMTGELHERAYTEIQAQRQKDRYIDRDENGMIDMRWQTAMSYTGVYRIRDMAELPPSCLALLTAQPI